MLKTIRLLFLLVALAAFGIGYQRSLEAPVLRLVGAVFFIVWAVLSLASLIAGPAPATRRKRPVRFKRRA